MTRYVYLSVFLVFLQALMVTSVDAQEFLGAKERVLDYPHGPESGVRVYVQISTLMFVEIYPSGRKCIFFVDQADCELSGYRGVVLNKEGEDFRIFLGWSAATRTGAGYYWNKAESAWRRYGHLREIREAEQPLLRTLPGYSKGQTRFIYLLPSDGIFKQEYVAGLKRVGPELQSWFRQQLGGSTITLADPAFEVHRAHHSLQWFTSRIHGDRHTWWQTVYEDAQQSIGARFKDPNQCLVVYFGAEIEGNHGAGAESICIMPEEDLQGLIGHTPQPVSRWWGGSGHELGHALGLPHPPECEDADASTSCPEQALMYLGYLAYPNCFLTEDDKEHLLHHCPFVSPGTEP